AASYRCWFLPSVSPTWVGEAGLLPDLRGVLQTTPGRRLKTIPVLPILWTMCRDGQFFACRDGADQDGRQQMSNRNRLSLCRAVISSVRRCLPTDCKSVYPGSTPGGASRLTNKGRQGRNPLWPLSCCAIPSRASQRLS